MADTTVKLVKAVPFLQSMKLTLLNLYSDLIWGNNMKMLRGFSGQYSVTQERGIAKLPAILESLGVVPTLSVLTFQCLKIWHRGKVSILVFTHIELAALPVISRVGSRYNTHQMLASIRWLFESSFCLDL